MATQEPKPQSVTSAWVQLLRREVVVSGSRDLARVAQVGVWMATFANADGTSIKVGQKTVATLTATSVESVSRAVKVLVEAGMMRTRRRPNQTTEYILVLPLSAPGWDDLLPIFTDTRQRRDHSRRKAAEMEVRLFRAAPLDTVRGRVPDTVRAGDSGHRPWLESRGVAEVPDTVRGRGRNASVDVVRTPSVAGGTMSYLPPVVTSTEDLATVAHSPQPQVGGSECGEPNRIQLVPPLPGESLDPGVALRQGLQSKPKRHTPWIDRRGQS